MLVLSILIRQVTHYCIISLFGFNYKKKSIDNQLFVAFLDLVCK